VPSELFGAIVCRDIRAPLFRLADFPAALRRYL
jgi:hypothetical protein